MEADIQEEIEELDYEEMDFEDNFKEEANVNIFNGEEIEIKEEDLLLQEESTSDIKIVAVWTQEEKGRGSGADMVDSLEPAPKRRKLTPLEDNPPTLVDNVQSRAADVTLPCFVVHEGNIVELKPSTVNLGPKLQLPAQSLHNSSQHTNQKPTTRSSLSTPRENKTKCSSTPTVKADLFPCRLCVFKFRHKQNLTKHERQHEPHMVQQCNLCVTVCSSPVDLSLHFRLQHPTLKHKTKFVCTVCQYSTKSIHHFKEHNITHNTDRELFCSKCRKNCENKKEFLNHKSLHSSGKSIGKKESKLEITPSVESKLSPQSEEKSRRFELMVKAEKELECISNQSVLQEKEKLLSDYFFSCQKCEFHCWRLFSFVNHHYTDSHIKTVFTCTLCSKPVEEMTNYINHVLIEHPKTPEFSCHLQEKHCTFRSNKKKDFEEHWNLHNLKHCPRCTFATPNLQCLILHMKIHENQCETNRCFMSPTDTMIWENFVTHNRKHKNEDHVSKKEAREGRFKFYVCSKCPFKTPSIADFKPHRDAHLRLERDLVRCRISVSINHSQKNSTVTLGTDLARCSANVSIDESQKNNTVA